jgi:hypothetical protein
MSKVKVAVAVGMITAVALFFPTFELLISGCSSDATCSVIGRSLAAIVASCSVGALVAWVVERLLSALTNRRAQERRGRAA